MNAWQRNVLLVSPSTLLFVVRTVANLWRQEEQHRNAQEIARRGAELYDRLCNFVDDLHRVGKNLDDARQAYEQAHRRLSTGKGNLIRQAEMLKALGVQPTKQLPRPLLEVAEDETGKGDPDAAPTAPGAGAAVVGLPRAAAGARPEQP
jgi:DNA recombination protein RmuC